MFVCSSCWTPVKLVTDIISFVWSLRVPASKVTLTSRKAANTTDTFEVCVEGDSVNLKSPSAVQKIENNPLMQQKLLGMQNEINAILGQASIAVP